ncbi:hypothetical protein Tco_0008598 [Tanacetum coccineum]
MEQINSIRIVYIVIRSLLSVGPKILHDNSLGPLEDRECVSLSDAAVQNLKMFLGEELQFCLVDNFKPELV